MWSSGPKKNVPRDLYNHDDNAMDHLKAGGLKTAACVEQSVNQSSQSPVNQYVDQVINLVKNMTIRQRHKGEI